MLAALGKQLSRAAVQNISHSPTALPDDLRSPIRTEREELRNLHFFPPEYGRECGLCAGGGRGGGPVQGVGAALAAGQGYLVHS